MLFPYIYLTFKYYMHCLFQILMCLCNSYVFTMFELLYPHVNILHYLFIMHETSAI